MRRNPQACSWRTSETSATFEASDDMGEHRLCEKGAAERHAIQSAYQLSFLPGFNGMGVPEFV